MLVLIRRNVLWSVLGVGLVVLLLYRLGGVLTPFILGTAIAYFLDPVADRLQRVGLSRAWAVAVISMASLALLLLLILLLLPAIIEQLTQLVNAVPNTVRSATAWLTEEYPQLMEPGGFLYNTLTEVADRFRAEGLRLLGGTLRSVVSVIATIFLFIATPTVAIYLLYDWDRMVAAVDRRLPREHAPLVRRLARDIDSVLNGFVRGQVIVGTLLATFYSGMLMALGLKYALLIGITSGMLNFIPWLGSFAGFVISTGVALVQFWGDWWRIAAVAFLFVFGQVMEGNVITPRIVGDSVKLHPVWLIVSLAVFGALFGFVGLLMAVPIAASIGVVVRWLDERYLDPEAEPEAEAPPRAPEVLRR